MHLRFSITLLLSFVSGIHSSCETRQLPTKAEDFDEPDWKLIIEVAFPPWATPANGCPRLDKVGGKLESGYKEFPVPEEGKFNPCYYTKAMAGIDPKLGGYPTPIDTHYPYEFAAPFFSQPGDGSTHHCPLNAPADTKIQTCPQVKTGCGPDCVELTDEYGIGHIPPFVTLNAVKKGYNQCTQDICTEWYDFETNGCNIKPSKLDELIYSYFGSENKIKFGPPKLTSDGQPSDFYYELEYLCGDGSNCRGPHYCSDEVATEDVWGDFCPYVHTGDNAGQYRHPHVAFAALELWIANTCMPDKCPSEWLNSPNGQEYGNGSTSTSITWADMADNNDPISQPKVPYKWPNEGKGIFVGHELYDGLLIKKAKGSYVTEFVAKNSKMPVVTESAASMNSIGFMTFVTSMATGIILSFM